MKNRLVTMWPNEIPRWVESDPRRSAEVRVYKALEKSLGNDWYVFYSRPWWGLSDKGGELDGEADFILAHPDDGLLFLEVKGGRISYCPMKGEWTTTDRHNIEHRIKDPVYQANTCKHRFITKLKSILAWPKQFVRIRHGVVFPDSIAPSDDELSIGGYDKTLFCCAHEFTFGFREWIKERMKEHNLTVHGSEIGPGTAGIGVVNDLLARPIGLKLSLSRIIDEDIISIDQMLTGTQLTILGMLENKSVTVVEGGAGTGKTVLAAELAVREAEKGRRVLFCCRSDLLVSRLSAQQRGKSSIDYLSYSSLEKIINGSTKSGPDSDMHLWDTVIIDEAQDFEWDWWDLILGVMAKKSGRLRVFSDANQAIHRRRDDLVTRLGAESFHLSVNLRNTRNIAALTEGLYKGPLITAPGPNGTAVSIEVCTENKAIERTVQDIHNLLTEQKISPSRITVLTPDSNSREVVRESFRRAAISISNASEKPSKCVTIETISRFKGLESDVLFMICDKLVCRNLELCYVGVSRARSILYIKGPINGSHLYKAYEQSLSSLASH
jgi:hypothetical protein